MPIKIQPSGEKYLAAVTPPHANDSMWYTERAMDFDQLIEAPLGLGCHQTDIADAFIEADPVDEISFRSYLADRGRSTAM